MKSNQISLMSGSSGGFEKSLVDTGRLVLHAGVAVCVPTLDSQVTALELHHNAVARKGLIALLI